MKKDHLLLWFVGFAAAVLLYFSLSTSGPETAGSGNLPDAANYFSQIASRSSKAVVKAANGRVFSVVVTNHSASPRYFQLHDQTATPGSSSTPELSIPLPGATSTASASVTILDSSFFAPAMKFSNGIAFSVSSVFATFATASVDPLKVFVEIRYE